MEIKGINIAALPDVTQAKVAVIGLGYVGLPLAVEFSAKYQTVGFDISTKRIEELRQGKDRTGEVADLSVARELNFTNSLDELRDCNVYIVTVPTPIDDNHQPDLTPLLAASDTVGRVIGTGDVVIYESTVYPGATEDDCVPVIEKNSGLRFNSDFFVGYSPERINPGDKARPLTKIVKVTSGSNEETAEFVDALYRSIITAGTYRASSIKVAEAAKVIENTQRDVNIALINELSMVFARLGIDTSEVIDAAATKWNFMKLKPGLVGGHCIGVDPYYLLHRSARAGHIPDIIRLSREINDGMPREAARRLIRSMIEKDIRISRAKVLILGATFKENCPDVRNTKVFDLAAALREWGVEPVIADPHADPDEIIEEYGVALSEPDGQAGYEAVVLAVMHDEYTRDGGAALKSLAKPGGIFFDMKAAFAKQDSDLRL
ncbi:nucleotide sugar dehydrogenase [Paracoccus sediminicola]|uniref:nucleotide sugar dehydrogenase n=1 Tax=Paracoccus sediminicola TaxID=3017783 RepID=UPI0022F09E2B|nr:nucleotide sugar dehydrogenase [Paracoccus sediminicola]WBU55511.1 nucleotide sugar dehydrogenase [Paracoccus sediminicola]